MTLLHSDVPMYWRDWIRKNAIHKLMESSAKKHLSQEHWNDALILAAALGNYFLVEWFVDGATQRVDIHANDDEALRLAAQNGHPQVVAFLLERGADITARDNFSHRTSRRQVNELTQGLAKHESADMKRLVRMQRVFEIVKSAMKSHHQLQELFMNRPSVSRRLSI